MAALLSSALIFILLIGSVIGGLILWLFARTMGKISNAGFGNSFLVCLVSSVLYILANYLIGINGFLSLGLPVFLLLNVFILSGIYITVGKLIWNCDWMQSFKANIIWILLYVFIVIGLPAMGLFALA